MRESEITPVGTIISEQPALDNRFFPVIERVVKTLEGEIREPQLVWDKREKEFSVALALTSDDKFVLITEPKYGQMREFLVVPTGGVKMGETPEDAAKREFTEETGFIAQEWILLKTTKMVDSPDKSDGGEHNFFLGLNATQASMPEKYRRVVLVSKEDAEKLIDEELEGMKLEVAMSYVALASAIRFLDKVEETDL